MSKVYSRFDLPQAQATESGDRMRDTYKWSKTEKGEEYLEHDADVDRQAEIESYADECDIKNIVARAALDPVFAEQIRAPEGQYADITEYPETIHDLKRMADEAGKTIEEINTKLNQTKKKPEEEPKKEPKKEPKEEPKDEQK